MNKKKGKKYKQLFNAVAQSDLFIENYVWYYPGIVSSSFKTTAFWIRA